jgi:radical SAM superfamily enzyme YgiQ (UPF0313 family)
VARDRALVQLFTRAKCITLFIGVESINPEALKDYHKSQSVQWIRESMDILNAEGLNVHSMFILGADSDTQGTIEKTIRFSRESGSMTTQFSILFPIPGTQLYDQMKVDNRIYINDWDYYDGSHSVILPKNTSPLELQKKFIHGYRHFYSRKLLHWLASRVGFMIWKLPNAKYMKYIRYVSRRLRKEGIVKDGIRTFRGFRTDALPRAFKHLFTQRKKLIGKSTFAGGS